MNLKLNLGCGSHILDGGWENIDLYPVDERVMKADIRKLPYEPGTVTEIRAQDVFEHIPRADARLCLEHWFSILRQGGTVEIRCPDMWKQAELLLNGTWSPDTCAHMVFGGQDSPGNFHMSGYTPGSLTVLLTKVGFRILSVRLEHEEVAKAGNANFRVVAVKP